MAEKPKVIKNRPLRLLLMACGFLFLFLAFLGAILPVVPTTPFLLVAAACFYRSSEKFYNFIMNNKHFGKYLRDYKSGAGIPLNIKIVTLSSLWISTLVSIYFFIPYSWLKILVFIINIIITIHIYRFKTKKGD